MNLEERPWYQPSQKGAVAWSGVRQTTRSEEEVDVDGGAEVTMAGTVSWAERGRRTDWEERLEEEEDRSGQN
jgi:hypothetical protein